MRPSRVLAVSVFLCQVCLGQTEKTNPLVNLGLLESTQISASSVNGARDVDDQYYGALNLFDGGENLINRINYTTWLSDNESRHWVKMHFETPAEVDSIMLEVPGKEPGPGPNLLPTIATPAGMHECLPGTVPRPRPTEFAIDLTTVKDGIVVTHKLPSVEVTGFRLYYPLSKPVQNVTELSVVFPGPSILEVSELEVMGVPSKQSPLRKKKVHAETDNAAKR